MIINQIANYITIDAEYGRQNWKETQEKKGRRPLKGNRVKKSYLMWNV